MDQHGFLDRYKQKIKSKTIETYNIFSEAKKKGKEVPRKVEPMFAERTWHRVVKLLRKTPLPSKVEDLFEKKSSIVDITAIVIEDMLKSYNININQEQVVKDILFASVAILTRGKILPNDLFSSVRIRRKNGESWIEMDLISRTALQIHSKILVLLLIVANKLREYLHLDKFRVPSREISARIQEEVILYASMYGIQVDEGLLVDMIPKLGIEITSDYLYFIPVSQHRNISLYDKKLENYVRGGVCSVYLALLKHQNRFEEWGKKFGLFFDWFDDDTQGINLQKKKFFEKSKGGKPIFSLGGNIFSFRIRFGRARNTGGSVVGIHPVTMALLGITTGTQLFLENEPWECTIAPVTSIEPPLVKYKSGKIKRLKNYQKALARLDVSIVEIIQLGDLLIDPAIFDNIAFHPGYTEDQWSAEARKSLIEMDESFKEQNISSTMLLAIKNYQKKFPSLELAIKISNATNIPIHPKYTPAFSSISKDEIKVLYNWLKKNHQAEDYENHILSRTEDKNEKIVSIFEKLLIPFHYDKYKKQFLSPLAKIFELAFDLGKETEFTINDGKTSLENVNNHSIWKFREKYPDACLYGASLGRIETTRIQRIKPNAHFLFPLKRRKIKFKKFQELNEKLTDELELVAYKCKNCGKVTYKPYCYECDQPIDEKVEYGLEKNQKFEIDLSQEIENAMRTTKVNIDELRGVNKLKSREKKAEHFAKGVLRSSLNLYVYRDGSSRVSATNMILTHFKPFEIDMTIKRLRTLGYNFDKDGRPLRRENQVVELRENDIIINEKIAEYILRVSKFVDAELRSLYFSEPVYRCEAIDDLIGKLVVGIGKSSSVGLVGRIIGFCKADVCYAHPLWHSSKGTGISGQEDSILLLGDALLNCSTSYLPPIQGTILGYPIFVSINVDYYSILPSLKSITKVRNIPYYFFYLLQKDDENKREIASRVIESTAWSENCEEAYRNLLFNQKIRNIDIITHENIFGSIKSILERIEEQIKFASVIKAINVPYLTERVLAILLNGEVRKHLSKYLNQKLRCSKCKAVYERVTITGKCLKCGAKLTLSQSPKKKLDELFIRHKDIRKVSETASFLFDYLNLQTELVLGKKQQLPLDQ